MAYANLEDARRNQREWKQRNPERVRELNRAWRAKNADKQRRYHRAYYLRNRDRYLAFARAWASAHPESSKETALVRQARMRANGGSFTREEWRELVAAYFGRCIYCGTAGSLGPDHIVPVALGGTSHIDNIVPACRSCNSSKNDRSLIVFLALRAA